MTDAPRFLHLRTHSEHSLLEGAMTIDALVKRAKAEGMPALALTDTNALFGALEFSVKAMAEGVQPIVGCAIALDGQGPLVLLAQDEAGWLNLSALSSALFLRETGATAPHVTLAEVEAHAGGLIGLTGGAGGPLGRAIAAGRPAEARALAERLAAAFPGRLYVELQRHPDVQGRLPEAEAATEAGLVGLAHDLDLPLVATNDVHFADEAMFDAHDALLCIADKAYVDQRQPRRRLTPEHRFKTEAEMAALFADLPEALESTVEIARRCAFAVAKRKPILPRFADDEAPELRRMAHEGLAARLATVPHATTPEAYRERLDFELGVIEQMGFPGYFLIVADFIQWAKRQGIPVGPGRGSGAGSVVAWALTITDLDPIRYGLLFERFLNPERVSMPDFDIDFCMDRREEVIAYVADKYGHDRVGQIITFGALLSKAAVRDVGRVLQMPYGQVDRLSKMIPVVGVKPVSVETAVATEPRLAEAAKAEPQVARLLDYAGKLEGLYRNASTHAAGIVIGDRPLPELVPLYRDPASDMPATQFNMKWVEAAGLVKFDFLGLKTLTVIDRAVKFLAQQGETLDIAAIPLDDPATYALFASARTVAVFQVESPGMMDALRRMRPTCIEDIVALVALYRPGPMANIPVYCDVKNGLRPAASLHPSIDHILGETQGIIVYQEQVMQIAQEMAGYSLGGADLLRRAMGKKIAAEMARERPKFIEGAVGRGVDERKAGEVFDLLEKFADYGFNKSHAAAYAVVSYQTAWLKANRPVAFMAAVMDCDIHLTDKLAVYRRELQAMGIRLLPPCVNRSEAGFAVAGEAIVYALGALKGVGLEAMRVITAARGDRPFADLTDFARRVDLRRVGKKPLETLARAGAFDALDANRARVLASLEGLAAWSAAVQAQAGSAQNSLFGGGEDLPPPRPAMAAMWLPSEVLAQEHAAVGFYLSGHPLDDHAGALKRRGVMSFADLHAATEAGPIVAKVAGVVGARSERKSARGTRYAFVSLSDPSGLAECTVFSDLLDAHRGLLEPGAEVAIRVQAERAGDQLKLLANSIRALADEVAEAPPGWLAVTLAGPDALPGLAEMAARVSAEVRAPARARGPLRVRLPDAGREVEVQVLEALPLVPAARQMLRAVPGVLAVAEV